MRKIRWIVKFVIVIIMWKKIEIDILEIIYGNRMYNIIYDA